MDLALPHAPSWFLVIVILALLSIGALMLGLLVWIARVSLRSLHKRLESFDEKLGKIADSLGGFTPVAQHNSAYDKLHTRIDVLTERVTRLEERGK